MRKAPERRDIGFGAPNIPQRNLDAPALLLAKGFLEDFDEFAMGPRAGIEVEAFVEVGGR